MLTMKELDKMKPDTIFDYGIGKIKHPWFNCATPVSVGGTLESDGLSTKVKWVAVAGHGQWAIYHSMDANIVQADYFDDPIHLEASNELIARAGAKLHDRETIRLLVPCDDEVLGSYRD